MTLFSHSTSNSSLYSMRVRNGLHKNIKISQYLKRKPLLKNKRKRNWLLRWNFTYSSIWSRLRLRKMKASKEHNFHPNYHDDYKKAVFYDWPNENVATSTKNRSKFTFWVLLCLSAVCTRKNSYHQYFCSLPLKLYLCTIRQLN